MKFFAQKILKCVIVCLSVVEVITVFFVRGQYTLKVQETLSLISKSDT